jgi:hypothetical protein
MSEQDRDENKTNIEFSIENKTYSIEWDGSQFVVTIMTTLKNTIRTDRKYYNWLNPMLRALSTEISANRKSSSMKELHDLIVQSMGIIDDVMRMIDIRYPSITLKIGESNE